MDSIIGWPTDLRGGKPRRGRYGIWIYPTLDYAIAEVGLQEVGAYVSRRQNTVAQFIDTSNTMDLCLAAERRRRLGSRLSNRG